MAVIINLTVRTVLIFLNASLILSFFFVFCVRTLFYFIVTMNISVTVLLYVQYVIYNVILLNYFLCISLCR